MSAKKGLGRGFDSLIPTELLDESFDVTASQDETVSDLRMVKLSAIQADPDQPRQHFEEAGIAELAASISLHGIVQPLVVAPHGDGYQIVAGERRFRAAGQAGLDKVPVIVRTLTDQHKLELSLIENVQRRDLNPMETAAAYSKLRDQFNLTLEQIGERVGGKSVSAISNTLRLLRLPKPAQKALADGTLTEGQARPLIGHDDKLVAAILPTIMRENWSARKIEQYAAAHKPGAVHVTKPASVSKPYQAASERFAKHLATDVTIRTTATGKGQVVINFRNEDDLERIESLFGEN